MAVLLSFHISAVRSGMQYLVLFLVVCLGYSVCLLCLFSPGACLGWGVGGEVQVQYWEGGLFLASSLAF